MFSIRTTSSLHEVSKLITFITIQIIISTCTISWFWLLFDTRGEVIISHIIILSVFHLAIAFICLALIATLAPKYGSRLKYILAPIYGLFIVFLFFTYMLAFYGKTYNSQIFTFDILFGYLKNLNGFLKSMKVNSILAYSLLLVIPTSIIGLSLCFANLIYNGYVKLGVLSKDLLFQAEYSRIRKYTAALLVIISLLILLLFSKFPITLILFNFEEPITSTLISQPYQGQHINNSYMKREQLVRASYPKNIRFNRKNVVIIIVDALRADHLHLFGYDRPTSPFLDSLYGSGNLRKIDLSFSPAGASFPGINGILRSKIWANIGFQDFSIQKLLQDQGYKINFILAGDHTHFYGLKSFYGANGDFNYFMDGSDSKKYLTNDDRLIFEGLEDIDDFKGESSFFYFHLASVHTTGVRLDPYRLFKPDSPDKLDVENYTNRYDNGVRQTDAYIKAIFSVLKEKNYLQNSIVAITSDHGESLGSNGVFGHTHNVSTQETLVPILIFDTDKVEYQTKHFATSIDIAPTIIDRLGLPVPVTWEGQSMASKPEKEFTFHQMGDCYAVIHNKNNSLYKYTFNKRTKEEAVYDLKKDLYEKNDIIKLTKASYLSILRSKRSVFHIDTN